MAKKIEPLEIPSIAYIKEIILFHFDFSVFFLNFLIEHILLL